ncbi:hypothetical protein [Ilumatobacter sp.]|uniref:hypothetical protein n=1 Tax=Ilumatobacter sp. TaxID=1967498 RepID=UPI003B521D19
MPTPATTLLRAAAAAAVSLTALTAVVGAPGAGAAPPGDAVPASADQPATDQIIVTLDRPGRRLGARAVDAAAPGHARCRGPQPGGAGRRHAAPRPS